MDHYKLLGISQHAEKHEIKAALLRKEHLLAEAYKTLSDDDRRAQYDARLRLAHPSHHQTATAKDQREEPSRQQARQRDEPEHHIQFVHVLKIVAEACSRFAKLEGATETLLRFQGSRLGYTATGEKMEDRLSAEFERVKARGPLKIQQELSRLKTDYAEATSELRVTNGDMKKMRDRLVEANIAYGQTPFEELVKAFDPLESMEDEYVEMSACEEAALIDMEKQQQREEAVERCKHETRTSGSDDDFCEIGGKEHKDLEKDAQGFETDADSSPVFAKVNAAGKRLHRFEESYMEDTERQTKAKSNCPVARPAFSAEFGKAKAQGPPEILREKSRLWIEYGRAITELRQVLKERRNGGAEADIERKNVDGNAEKSFGSIEFVLKQVLESNAAAQELEDEG